MDMEIVFPAGKKVDALYKGFRIETDQSKKDGGEGSAPAPFDFFMVSIGTCAGIYALSFCQERNIPTENLKLFLRTEINKEKKRIGKIILTIQLPGEFPEHYRSAIVKAVNLCTVKRYMQDPPEFETITTAFSG
ncbi:MAG: osmotically inducible protein OsmC [Candidatus Schekmanbacteria bacterium RBG_13_48_7]|uniref:Osmotically inducible protein OsmC n=1 Tax=Candidatus Schekmanbacteria bacterium RBG_13_48_7 TaxID=1817878 RepID=A0A1F7S3P7_9BACT|nr:MAG: osmotically inducible protein OsmC [Candidatus Schekmanbacteria bacterium RBG_13_48_7]